MMSTYCCGQCHASRCKEPTALNSRGHHSKFAVFHECDEILHLFLQVWICEVGGLVRIRWLVTRDFGIAEGLLRHVVDSDLEFGCWYLECTSW